MVDITAADNKWCVVGTTGKGFVFSAAPGNACAKKDGSAAETAACSCGATLTPVASGKVCIEKSSVGYEVAKVECSKTDGTAKVTADCTCGYKTTMVDITAADNKWCVVGTTGKGFVFSAAPGNACAKTDGSANEGAACKCGTSTVVQVAQGKVCKVTNGVGVEHAALCAKTDGSAAETAACSCGATLTPVASGKVCIEKSSVGYEVAKV